MLNRRHLRIKVLQLLYAFHQSSSSNPLNAEKELAVSLDRLYDMYVFLLLTFDEMKRAAENKIEDKKRKMRPTEEDLHPNLKFVNNAVFRELENSSPLKELSKKRKVNWTGVEAQEMFRKMFLVVLESEVYTLYLNDEKSDFETDRNFAIQFFKEQIANSELLYHFFDEKSVYWMDDLDLCCTMVLKSLKTLKEGEPFEPLPLYKDEEDEATFVKDLLLKTILHDQLHQDLVTDLAKNWEADRIAKMDMLMIKMGLTELMYFNSIPTKVTINEYIEISKYYSTPKSNIFINGILDKAVEKLTAEKKIVKIGRGLIN